jgi:hypothetical protein
MIQDIKRQINSMKFDHSQSKDQLSFFKLNMQDCTCGIASKSNFQKLKTIRMHPNVYNVKQTT